MELDLIANLENCFFCCINGIGIKNDWKFETVDFELNFNFSKSGPGINPE